MPLDDIKKRTAERKATGKVKPYPHHRLADRTESRAPVRDRPPACAKLGADTGDTVRCPSCSGTVELKVFACAEFGACTVGRAAPGVACCTGCESYTAPLSGLVKRVTVVDGARLAAAGDGRHFNGSILEHDGRLLMAYRAGWGGATVHVATLGADLQPVRTVPVELRHPRCAAGREDPRLFLFGGVPHLAFGGVQWAGGRMTVSQMLARLTPDLTAERVWEPRYAARTFPMEKNWQFFEAAGALWAVYGVVPNHVVLRVDAEAGTADPAFAPPAPLRWSGGLVRGGAPPVRVGGEFYHWFHGWKRSKRAGTPHGDWYDYSVGVYTFAAEPPFAVTRYTPDPVWLGDPGKLALNVTPDKNVIYPSGALRDGDRWLVSAGHQDHEVVVGEFAVSDIESALVPL